MDPCNAHALRGLGDCHRDTAEHHTAISFYQQALEFVPGLIEARSGLGVSLKEVGRVFEAELQFEAVVGLAPECALALGNLASCYYDNNKPEKAVETYQRALLHQPHFPEALNNLGNALRELGRLEEALQCYRRCIQTQLAASVNLVLSSTASSPAVPAASSISISSPSGFGSGSPAAATVPSTGVDGTQVQRLAVSYNNLAGVLKLQGRVPECVAAYQQVIALQPSAEAFANLASGWCILVSFFDTNIIYKQLYI